MHIVVYDRGHAEPFDGQDWSFKLSVDEQHDSHNGTVIRPTDHEWHRLYQLQARANTTTIHTTAFDLGELHGDMLILRLDAVNIYPNGAWQSLKTHITIYDDGRGYEVFSGLTRPVCSSWDSNSTCPWYESSPVPPAVPGNLPVETPEPALVPGKNLVAVGFPPPGVASTVRAFTPLQQISAEDAELTIQVDVTDLGVPVDFEDWVFRLYVDEDHPAQGGTITPPSDANWHRKYTLQQSSDQTTSYQFSFQVGEVKGERVMLRVDYQNADTDGPREAWSLLVRLLQEGDGYRVTSTLYYACDGTGATTCPSYGD